LALAYARSADAERLRGEMTRGILDMLAAGRQTRLATVRDLMKSAAALDAALAGPQPDTGEDESMALGSGRGRRARATKKASAADAVGPAVTVDAAAGDGATADAAPDTDSATADEAAAPKLAASDRRSAAGTLIDIWAAVARDLAVARAGGVRRIREVELMDELPVVAARTSEAAMTAFLAQLGTIDRQLDENVNPELALDVLALSWPHAESPETSAASATAARPRR